jgi:hypothetical protein
LGFKKGFFTATQLLFRTFALCHVHVGTNAFDNISGFIENQVSDSVDVLYRAIRQHNPVILHKISFRAYCLVDSFVKSVAIFGVHQSKELFRIWEVASLRI